MDRNRKPLFMDSILLQILDYSWRSADGRRNLIWIIFDDTIMLNLVMESFFMNSTLLVAIFRFDIHQIMT